MPNVTSPLVKLYCAVGIVLREYHGAILPASLSDPAAEHAAVRHAVGFFDLAFRSKFAVTGTDRVTFLHNMLSNDIKSLAPGEGVYATLLNVKGHVVADLRVYVAQDEVYVDTDADLRAKVLATLDRYILMDEVQLEPLDLFAMSFQGPKSREFVSHLLRAPVPLGHEFQHLVTAFGGCAIHLARATSTGEEGFEIWADAGTLRELWKAAANHAPAFAALPCGTAALETLRIEAGIPRYGAELDEETLPLEADLLEALSFTKGCYLGQEIVERSRSRGHVNWKLVGLVADSTSPMVLGENLLSDGKEIGEITSAADSPTLGKTVALAYVRREFSEPGTKLTLESGATAEVTALPFYRRATLETRQ